MTAVMAVLAACFVYMAMPGSFGPMFRGGPRLAELIMVVGGLSGVAIGFGWMVRIYRANPEPDQQVWRYREFD